MGTIKAINMHYMKDTVRQEEADYTPIGALKMFVPGQ